MWLTIFKLHETKERFLYEISLFLLTITMRVSFLSSSFYLIHLAVGKELEILTFYECYITVIIPINIIISVQLNNGYNFIVWYYFSYVSFYRGLVHGFVKLE